MSLEFISSLSSQFESFVRFRKAGQKWTDESSYDRNIHYFDRHCAKNFPNAAELSQEMVDLMCTPCQGHFF